VEVKEIEKTEVENPEDDVVEVKIVKSDNTLEENVKKMKYIDDSSGDSGSVKIKQNEEAPEVVTTIVNEEAGKDLENEAPKLNKKESMHLKKEKERSFFSFLDFFRFMFFSIGGSSLGTSSTAGSSFRSISSIFFSSSFCFAITKAIAVGTRSSTSSLGLDSSACSTFSFFCSTTLFSSCVSSIPGFTSFLSLEREHAS
jgi:hypothetical protein